MKELKDIKNEFKVNHATRMEELNKAIKSLTQNSETSETKNTKKIKAMADLLASL